MNYVPFTFVESIHEEKHRSLGAVQRRHNDGFMPQPALMPDPIGLLFSQIHRALDRGVARAIQAIFHTVPTVNEAATTNFMVEPQPQPLASAVAKRLHKETVTDETEKNNVTRYDARQLST